MQLEEGDLILTATDGMFDNVHTKDIIEVVNSIEEIT